MPNPRGEVSVAKRFLDLNQVAADRCPCLFDRPPFLGHPRHQRPPQPLRRGVDLGEAAPGGRIDGIVHMHDNFCRFRAVVQRPLVDPHPRRILPHAEPRAQRMQTDFEPDALGRRAPLGKSQVLV